MHLLVLSAFRLDDASLVELGPWGLNAPSGAQCFPSYPVMPVDVCRHQVSMHLLVLSAFRPELNRKDW